MSAEHVDSYIAFIVSGEQKIDARVSYFQVTNAHSGKEGWQKWLRKNQPLFGSQYAQAETSLKQKKHRTRCPCLRSAGYRIERRRFARAPGEAAK
jgi:hypothetical protein